MREVKKHGGWVRQRKICGPRLKHTLERPHDGSASATLEEITEASVPCARVDRTTYGSHRNESYSSQNIFQATAVDKYDKTASWQKVVRQPRDSLQRTTRPRKIQISPAGTPWPWTASCP